MKIHRETIEKILNNSNDEIGMLKSKLQTFSEFVKEKREKLEMHGVNQVPLAMINHVMTKCQWEYRVLMAFLLKFGKTMDKNHYQLGKTFDQVCFDAKAIYDGNQTYFKYLIDNWDKQNNRRKLLRDLDIKEQKEIEEKELREMFMPNIRRD